MIPRSDEYARQLYNAVVEYMDSLANPHNFQRLNEAILHLNEQSSETGFPEVGRELKVLAFQISEARAQIATLIAQYEDETAAESGPPHTAAAGAGVAESQGPLPAASRKLLHDIVDIANCIAAMLLELSEMCEDNESSREICSYVILVNEVIVEAITHLRNERAAIAALLERLLQTAGGDTTTTTTGAGGASDDTPPGMGDHSRYCVDKTGRIVRQPGI